MALGGIYMKKIKDFIKTCRLNYQTKKEDELLRLIIYYAIKFDPISILDRPLLFCSRFNEKTVKSVADALGYDFLFYPEKNRHSSIIIFSEKTGTCEGD